MDKHQLEIYDAKDLDHPLISFGLTQIVGNYSPLSYAIASFWLGFWGGVAFKNQYKDRLKD